MKKNKQETWTKIWNSRQTIEMKLIWSWSIIIRSKVGTFWIWKIHMKLISSWFVDLTLKTLLRLAGRAQWESFHVIAPHRRLIGSLLICVLKWNIQEYFHTFTCICPSSDAVENRKACNFECNGTYSDADSLWRFKRHYLQYLQPIWWSIISRRKKVSLEMYLCHFINWNTWWGNEWMACLDLYIIGLLFVCLPW